MLIPNKFWLAGISATGSKHTEAGMPCEDSHYVGRDGESFVLVACDGAGARALSRYGAEAVAQAIGPLLLQNATDIMSRRLGGKAILSVALDAIAGAMGEYGGDIEDYACTLVALLVHEGRCMTCHVGDGAIYVIQGVYPSILSPPQGDGRFTFFVTTDGVRPRMWGRALQPYMTGFLVATDGADALANYKTGETSSLVTKLVTRLALASENKAQHLLAKMCAQELAPYSQDDITILAAKRAFTFGMYGCPECCWPKVRNGQLPNTHHHFGRCPNCGCLAYLITNPEEAKVYEYIRAMPTAP